MCDERGAGFVRGDLVVDRVRAHQFARQFAAGTGGAHAEHAHPVAPFFLPHGELPLNDLHRPALGARIDFIQNPPLFVQQYQVGAHRTDVDAQIGVQPSRGWLRPGRRLSKVHQIRG